MLKRLLPRETCFFDYFEQLGNLIVQTCESFAELCAKGNDLPARTGRIKELEHQADQITYTCINALHRTFITPIDRSDIHHLAKHLDDVIDSVDAAASRIFLYEISEIRPEAVEMSQVLVRSAKRIQEALQALRDMANHDKINDCCIAIHELENECDALLRAALGRLFKEEQRSPIYIIKWKEIFELLELAADQSEDVADIIEGIVIEAS